MNNKWFTMSIHNKIEKIVDKEYIDPERDWIKIQKGLTKYSDILSNLKFGIQSKKLWKINYELIDQLLTLLEIDLRKMRLDFPTEKKGTDRLIEICQRYDCDTYLAGFSHKDYLEMDKFTNANIKVIFQEEKNIVKEPVLSYLLKKRNKLLSTKKTGWKQAS